MKNRRTIGFIGFYIIVVALMLFTYLYVQKNYAHEVTHQEIVK